MTSYEQVPCCTIEGAGGKFRAVDVWIFILDCLKLLKLLSIPETYGSIDSNCNNLVLLIIQKHVEYLCVYVCLNTADYSKCIGVNKEHVAL